MHDLPRQVCLLPCFKILRFIIIRLRDYNTKYTTVGIGLSGLELCQKHHDGDGVHYSWLNLTKRSIQVLHQSLSHNADTADTLEGFGGSKPKCKHADTLWGKGGRAETWCKYCCKIIEITFN